MDGAAFARMAAGSLMKPEPFCIRSKLSALKSPF
jgi:hypothetical protein